nr:MAG TPA: hypothetical protein [Caudoviricetes sp.]
MCSQKALYEIQYSHGVKKHTVQHQYKAKNLSNSGT